ncbi:MAG TPA: DUF2279 domain-containing protein [Cyclobacteriaceae bacterium]|nr:YfiM family protein [Cyclobacteriaceae bacterium]HMV09455.1 DUF2279 domain-containing protein [Cyclobacteriaceae bacterium]HMV89458.1 DUF2279 domain-containing protein [Cyclobacteriaceae bacterium]HMX02476.1 DUF2279 domain-containing protein [Cyclobacteriaceae bacterium]HMX51036.1 DUF2279 domain-containing protein [Cyclobacteriaceae bacterium]
MRVRNSTLVLFICAALITGRVSAQQIDSLQVNKKRLTKFVVFSSVAYTGTMIGLSELWYKDSGHQSFRFFNDNAEWKQIDKLGHFYAGFYFSYGTSKALRWSNVPARKSDLIGAATGFLILTPIEIFDGFSDAYGASTGDLMANAAGSVFFLGQSLLWNETRIYPKFSFHQTNYAHLRPNTLGDNFSSELLKDYNGQTYWICADMDKFMKFPKWLNLAVGYGAQGMVYARDSQNNEAGYSAYRQYYLSVDFDLTGIRTSSKVLKTFFRLVSLVKLPAPAMELSKKGVKFHPLYF